MFAPKRGAAVLWILVFTAPLHAADPYAAKLNDFEATVRAAMQAANIPGLTIGFVKDDYIWVKGFGFADLENKTPARADSSYRLAPVLKSMTAAGDLQVG